MTSRKSSGPTPLLSVRDLRIAFGAKEAVRGVSFEIAPGETLGLVGESGSGKSLTSLAIMRLLPPNTTVNGNITFVSGESSHEAEGAANGHPPQDLLTLPERAMRAQRGRSIAMIFQEPMTALNPVMTVGRQLAEAVLAHAPHSPRREVKERVLAAMYEVALPAPERRMSDYPHQFSGGQRQRIVIAMALINRPRLLVADEPTTALDVTVQAQILDLLRRLRDSHGLSMLFISHDLAVVGSIADRIAVMRQGEIVETGAAAELLRSPKHPYTQRLLLSAPTMTTRRDQPLATGS